MQNHPDNAESQRERAEAAEAERDQSRSSCIYWAKRTYGAEAQLGLLKEALLVAQCGLGDIEAHVCALIEEEGDKAAESSSADGKLRGDRGGGGPEMENRNAEYRERAEVAEAQRDQAWKRVFEYRQRAENAELTLMRTRRACCNWSERTSRAEAHAKLVEMALFKAREAFHDIGVRALALLEVDGGTGADNGDDPVPDGGTAA